jgi:acetyl esterase
VPLDPQAAAYLERLEQLGVRPVEQLTPEYARKQAERGASVLFGPVERVASVSEFDTDGVRVRLYDPAPGESRPILIWLHSGGWVACSPDTHDGPCRAIANRAGCRVASVDYRRAPEHCFPAAVEDAWVATCWAASQTSKVAIGGDSAGGNLAAVAALRARDAGLPLALQVLVNPVLDHDFSTPSYSANAEGKGLTRAAMRWYWDQCLGAQDGSQTEASPLRAASLGGVSPALIVVCEHDPLRDEGIAFAGRLRNAGIEVRLSRYEGMIHGFFRMAAVIDRTQDLLDECAAAVQVAFAQA